jgi:hypothetical protein
MKQTKTDNAKKNLWIVASKEEIEEASRKGLYKAITALPGKEKFYLCPIHIYDFIKMVSEEIEELVTYWHESGQANLTEEEYLGKLEYLLYMLEDLFSHNFRKYRVNGKLDYKKWKDGFVLCWILTTPLTLIRHLVAFPPLVEEFYQGFESDDIDWYKEAKICEICIKKPAYDTYTNITVHDKCAIDKGWYKCTVCNWLYPTEKKCERKKNCSEKKLLKAGTFLDPFE